MLFERYALICEAWRKELSRQPFFAPSFLLLFQKNKFKKKDFSQNVQAKVKQNLILRDPGVDSGGEGKSKQAGKYGTKKSKERQEEPLRTMSYQTSSKRLGRKTQKFSGTNQKSEWQRPFGTSLVRHCSQGLFSPFFTFLRAIFSRPFRLSLAPTICPWVSKDGKMLTCHL